MNTEKEILLNKEEVKALEDKIKDDEIFISKEGHNFTRIVFEHNLLILESAKFCEIAAKSKDDFVKTTLDVLNKPKNTIVEILRRNIQNIRHIYLNPNPSLSEKGELITRTKNKINLRFDIPYLTQEEAFICSSCTTIDIKHILDYSELIDCCEFDKEINLINA